jgi:hypothetical protein
MASSPIPQPNKLSHSLTLPRRVSRLGWEKRCKNTSMPRPPPSRARSDSGGPPARGVQGPGYVRAFDTTDDVQLADISELTIEGAPRFEELELFINGRAFFGARRAEAEIVDDTVRFQIRQ